MCSRVLLFLRPKRENLKLTTPSYDCVGPQCAIAPGSCFLMKCRTSYHCGASTLATGFTVIRCGGGGGGTLHPPADLVVCGHKA